MRIRTVSHSVRLENSAGEHSSYSTRRERDMLFIGRRHIPGSDSVLRCDLPLAVLAYFSCPREASRILNDGERRTCENGKASSFCPLEREARLWGSARGGAGLERFFTGRTRMQLHRRLRAWAAARPRSLLTGRCQDRSP